MRRRRPTVKFIVATTAMMWLATAIAATALWPVYESSAFLLMLGVTTVVASALAITGAVFRFPAHLVALSGVLAYVVLGVPLAVPGEARYGLLPTLPGLADLGFGAIAGWKQLLTVTLPVGSYESLLVPAFVLVLATVLVGVSVALRARVGELAVLAPFTLFLAGIILGSTTAFFPVASSLALTATLLLWLIFFRWYRRRTSSRNYGWVGDAGSTSTRVTEDTIFVGARTVLAAGLIIAIAAGGAVAATAFVPPKGAREVLRSTIVQPFDPRDYPSPLSGFRRYHQETNADATMLTVDGLPEGARIRIATLDTYDGVVYSVGAEGRDSDSGSFTLVPSRFDRSGLDGDRVGVDVSVGDYSGVWLPTIGAFESIRFTGEGASGLRGSFYFNDNSGSAAVIGELGEGDAYRLSSVLPVEPAPEALARVTPGASQLPALPVLPEDLSVALDRYSGQIQGLGARLSAAMTGLRAEGYISHGVADDEPMSRSGHSADRIAELFSEQQMIGDEEQYAVAAALMAREIGFPARVVVGFAPADAVPGGTTVITGADISAWIEVDTAQYGWVTIDPTPPERDIPDRAPEEPTQVARPQSPVQPPVLERDVPEDQLAPETAQDEGEVADPLLALLLLMLQVSAWTLLGIALLLSPFLAVMGAKLRRRHLRRTAASPLERISGGWHEFADAVLDHGYDPPGGATRGEYAHTVGGGRPLLLAAAADRAVFGPTEPSASEATRVWRSVDELRHSLDDGLTRRQRLRARISLRSLSGKKTT
ncbi:MAG: transglutaminase-like domain-containing protein [Microbacteriaceae bacterium]|nr:transglutaminase-like domain-containing protein [Microbacteriaceae bacterium]